MVAWHYASVLTFARWLGLDGLARFEFARLHAALLSILVVPAAFRIGRTLGGRLESAVLAAAAVALSPTLGYFSCHALAEWHAMVFLSFTYALWCEQASESEGQVFWPKSVFIGLLLGAAFIARPNYGVVIPLVLFDFVIKKRFRELFGIVLGVAVATAALGIIDWVTWGRPFKSIIVWVNYNIIEGRRGARVKTSFAYYFRPVLFGDYGAWAFVLLAAMVLTLKVTWRGLLGWLFPVLILSVLSNRQERFILPIWPCFLATAATSLVELREAVIRRVPQLFRSTFVRRLCLAVPSLILLFALAHDHTTAESRRWRTSDDLFRAQDWVHKQENVTGLAIDCQWYRSGAYVVTDRHIPILFNRKNPPEQRVFSHFIANEGSAKFLAKSNEWERLRRFGRYTIFQRRDRWIVAKCERPRTAR